MFRHASLSRFWQASFIMLLKIQYSVTSSAQSQKLTSVSDKASTTESMVKAQEALVADLRVQMEHLKKDNEGTGGSSLTSINKMRYDH